MLSKFTSHPSLFRIGGTPNGSGGIIPSTAPALGHRLIRTMFHALHTTRLHPLTIVQDLRCDGNAEEDFLDGYRALSCITPGPFLNHFPLFSFKNESYSTLFSNTSRLDFIAPGTTARCYESYTGYSIWDASLILAALERVSGTIWVMLAD